MRSRDLGRKLRVSRAANFPVSIVRILNTFLPGKLGSEPFWISLSVRHFTALNTFRTHLCKKSTVVGDQFECSIGTTNKKKIYWKGQTNSTHLVNDLSAEPPIPALRWNPLPPMLLPILFASIRISWKKSWRILEFYYLHPILCPIAKHLEMKKK